MTANQILFELAAQGCRCVAALSSETRERLEGRQLSSELANGHTHTATVRLCDPCVADNALRELERTYREANEQLINSRAAIACEIVADYIQARDADDIAIPECEDEE